MRAAPWSLVRRTPGLVAVLSLTLAATGAAPVRRAPTTGQVAGTVRDGTGTPIVHAQVQVVGTALSTLTDTAGAYLLAGGPDGARHGAGVAGGLPGRGIGRDAADWRAADAQLHPGRRRAP